MIGTIFGRLRLLDILGFVFSRLFAAGTVGRNSQSGVTNRCEHGKEKTSLSSDSRQRIVPSGNKVLVFGGAFLPREADVVWYFMSLFRSIGLAGIGSLMVLGCATNPYASRAAVAIQHVFRDQDDSHLWRVQKARQQRLAREAGRIGYIGNAGPALGSSLPSSCQ
jgi:hypothetical protein